MSYFVLILLGVLPSLIWLLYFLRKDPHPEPQSLIVQVFVLGALVVPIAFIFEWIVYETIKDILLLLIAGAFIEEIVKFFVVKWRMEKHRAFDEPADAIIYLIIVGLGFAALENIFYLCDFNGVAKAFQISDLCRPAFSLALKLSALRFLTSTFLHAFSSGSLGFFWALSLIKKNRFSHSEDAPPRDASLQAYFILIPGIIFAALTHTFYNYLIKTERFSLLPLLLIVMAALLISAFKKLRKLS